MSPPFFSLKWTKNRSAISARESNIEIEAPFDIDILDNVSEKKQKALAYMGGFIVRNLIKSVDCEECCVAMIASDKTKRELSLISMKDNGGLLYPSDDIVYIVTV